MYKTNKKLSQKVQSILDATSISGSTLLFPMFQILKSMCKLSSNAHGLCPPSRKCCCTNIEIAPSVSSPVTNLINVICL